jgi:hypothetical protein
MGFSFSLKPDEALEKFAAPLWIAFFTVAAIVQPAPWHIPCWLIATFERIIRLVPSPIDRSSPSPVLTVLITAALTGVFCATYGWLLFYVVLMLRTSFMNASASWINWLGTALLLSFGIGFISMGSLALCKIPLLHSMAIQDPLPSLNLLWEIGLFIYGVWWLQLYEVVEQKEMMLHKE